MPNAPVNEVREDVKADEGVADILSRAADLIEPEGAWTQGDYALDAEGVPSTCAPPEEFEPVCFCMIGAINAARGAWLEDAMWGGLTLPVTEVIGTRSLADWNDEQGRTQSEVVAALREAAAKARGAAQ